MPTMEPEPEPSASSFPETKPAFLSDQVCELVFTSVPVGTSGAGWWSEKITPSSCIRSLDGLIFWWLPVPKTFLLRWFRQVPSIHHHRWSCPASSLLRRHWSYSDPSCLCSWWSGPASYSLLLHPVHRCQLCWSCTAPQLLCRLRPMMLQCLELPMSSAPPWLLAPSDPLSFQLSSSTGHPHTSTSKLVSRRSASTMDFRASGCTLFLKPFGFFRLLLPSGSASILTSTVSASVLWHPGSTLAAHHRSSIPLCQGVQRSRHHLGQSGSGLHNGASIHWFRHGSLSSWLDSGVSSYVWLSCFYLACFSILKLFIKVICCI